VTATEIPGTASSALERRLERMATQLEVLTAEAEERRVARDIWGELVADLAPVSRETLAALTERLAVLDGRGYGEFASSSAGVLDRVVTAFGADDVDALGDNIVLILSTIRDMTQPEVMTMLRRTATSMGGEAPATTPSLAALLRQLRQPEVRRGLQRLLTMLATLGQPHAPRPFDERDKETPR
jgi:uncharacterized protein YjgD (DUF1641 family)